MEKTEKADIKAKVQETNGTNGWLPEEKKKIAARRAVRLAEKIKIAKEQVHIKSALWSNGVLEILLVVSLFFINLFIIYPLLNVPAVDQPYSGPVIPLLIKLIGLFGVPDAFVSQYVNTLFYLFWPVFFYLFVKNITKRKLISFLAVLIASIPIYPFAETRISAAFLGMDIAHMASLLVIPLALLTLHMFIEKGGTINLVKASVFSALIALISPFGFMTYMIFASIITFSEMLLEEGRLKLLRFMTIIFIAGSLNSFWYNPGFFIWMIAGPMGGGIRSTIIKLIPLSFFTIPILAAFGYLLFDRKPKLQPFFITSFFTISFLLISLAGGGVFPSHPSRYIPELGISLAFLLAVVFVGITDKLRRSQFLKMSFIRPGLLANCLLVVCVGIIVGTIIFSRTRLISDSRVPEIWDEVEKGEIWVARDKFVGPYTLLGYSITFLSVLGLVYFTIKERFINFGRVS